MIAHIHAQPRFIYKDYASKNSSELFINIDQIVTRRPDCSAPYDDDECRSVGSVGLSIYIVATGH